MSKHRAEAPSRRGLVRYLPYFLVHPARMLLLVVSVAGLTALQLVLPTVLGQFVDAARAMVPQPQLLNYGVVFVVASLGLQALGVLATITANALGWSATNLLRQDLVAHCLNLGHRFARRHPVGELIERADVDAGILANFFSRFAIEMVGSALLLVGIHIMLLRLNVVLGLSSLVFTALALWALGRLRQASRSVWHSARKASANLFGFAGEALMGLEDARANGDLPAVRRRFQGLQQAILPLQNRAMMVFGGAWAAPLLVFACGDALAMILAARLFTSDSLSLGQAVSAFFYIALLNRPIDQIRTQVQNLQRAEASLQRVGELFDEQPDVADTGTGTVPKVAPSLTFKGVGFQYDDTAEAVLHDVSFSVPAGSTVGLLGRTGSGKTTLTRLLFRFYDPTGGHILLNGQPLAAYALADLRQSIALITQDVQLLTATLRNNLELFDEAVTDDALWRALRAVDLEGWARDLPDGLESLIEPTRLSAGEAQLLALARVYLRDPTIIILDEPTSWLDRWSESRLTHALSMLMQGRTCLVIAHRLSTVQHLDQLVVLDHGRVIERGSPAELAQRPGGHYAKLLAAGLEIVS